MDILTYSLVRAILLADLVVLCLGMAILKRRSISLIFAALMISFCIVNACWLLGKESALFSLLGGAASIITFPLATLIVCLSLHPKDPGEQMLLSFLLISPAIGLGAWSVAGNVGAGQIHEFPLICLFAVFCVGVGMVDSVWEWLKARVFRTRCNFFMLALLTLLTTGPLYDFEFKMLGYGSLMGAGLGAPLVGAFLLAPLLMANPISMNRTSPTLLRKSEIFYSLDAKKCYAISEKRPKYCHTFLKDMANAGHPCLVITSSSSTKLEKEWRLGGVRAITLSTKDTSTTLKVTSLNRILATILDFMERGRKPAVLIDCLDYLLSNNDLLEVSELIQKLIEPVKRKGGWLLLSFSLLTKGEESRLLSLGLSHHRLPSPEEIIAKILSEHVGELSSQLMDVSCGTMGKRICDLTVEDIPQLSRIVVNSMRALGTATQETAITRNWEMHCRGIQDSLRHFHRAPISFLTSGGWRARYSLKKEVRSVDEEREGIDVTEAPTTAETSESGLAGTVLQNRVLNIFANSLGDFGKNLLQIECTSLGIEPGEMSPEDVDRLAEKAARTISELGNFVDVPPAYKTMKSKAKDLKEEMGRILREELSCYLE